MNLKIIIARRMVLLVFVVLGVSAVTFAISHVIPGDPARLVAGERATDETVARMRQQLGLDRPVWEQYVSYLGNFARGDLGISIRTQRPVIDDVRRFFPATIELIVASLLFSVLIGVPLGTLSAIRRDTWIDALARGVSLIGISMPAFWLGLLLIYLVYGQLGLAPGSGRIATSVAPPMKITGFYVFDSLVTGNWPALRSALAHLALPVVTLGLLNLGIVTRQIRSAMLEVLQEDFVRTARASGLSNGRILFNYALRNALIPSITMVGLMLGDLLYGAIMTETVFAFPGMGNYVVQSIAALDFPAIMGFTIVASTAYVLLNLVVDLAYIFVDPQIRAFG